MQLMPPSKKKKTVLKSHNETATCWAELAWSGLAWPWPLLLGSLTIAAAQ